MVTIEHAAREILLATTTLTYQGSHFVGIKASGGLVELHDLALCRDWAELWDG